MSAGIHENWNITGNNIRHECFNGVQRLIKTHSATLPWQERNLLFSELSKRIIVIALRGVNRI
jgi:hypothetical protein